MLLFCDGFDRYGTIADTSAKGWVIANQGAGNWTFLSSGGVNGGGAIQCEQDDQPAEHRIRPSGSTLDYIRIAGYYKSAGSPGVADWFVTFFDSTKAEIGGISITTAGEIGVVPSSSSITPTTNHVAGSSTSGANLHDGNWHFVEILYKSANTSGGRFKAKIDGVTLVDFTGDTTAGATTLMNTDVIRLYAPDTSAIWDDPMVWDDEVGPGLSGELSGTRVIATTSPDGAGDSATLTANTGTNWQAVDDSPFHDSDTTYVEGDTSLEKDLYTFGALPLTPVAIDCVVVNAVTKTQVGSIVTTQMLAKSGGVEADPGVTNTFSNVGYLTIQGAFDDDPDTAAAWTESGVNAAQFGIEMVS